MKSNCEYLEFQRHFDDGNFKKYFVDPVHLTDEGNEKLSRLIFENSKIIKDLLREKGGDKNAY